MYTRVDNYLGWLMPSLLIYITLFNILTGHLQSKWTNEFKRKITKIYFLLWAILYCIYLYCVWVTPTTKPYFFSHILLGIIIHIIFAVFGYRATMH